MDPNKKNPQKNTEDNFYEVQMTKCTKTLYQTDTIRPTVQYNTVQFNTVQYNTVQKSTVQYSKVQYKIVQYSMLHYNTIRYNTLH